MPIQPDDRAAVPSHSDVHPAVRSDGAGGCGGVCHPEQDERLQVTRRCDVRPSPVRVSPPLISCAATSSRSPRTRCARRHRRQRPPRRPCLHSRRRRHPTAVTRWRESQAVPRCVLRLRGSCECVASARVVVPFKCTRRSASLISPRTGRLRRLTSGTQGGGTV